MPNPWRCPRCWTQALHTAHASDLLVHACPSCAGVWLASPVASKALGPLAHELTPEVVGDTVECVQCARPMEVLRAPRAQVVVDRCREHGVWLDRDELMHISHAVAAMRGTAPWRLPDRVGAAVLGGAALTGAAIATASLDHAPPERHQGTAGSLSDGAQVLGTVAELGGAVADVTGHVAHAVVPAATHSAGVVVEATADGTEVAATAVEASAEVVEVSGSVLEASAEVVGAIFGVLGDLLS